MARVRTAVLVSGRGSNMAALLDAARDPGFPAEIALVVSNRPDAPALDRAAAAGIETRIVDHRGFDDRVLFEAAVDAALHEAEISVVCLAGFMRVLTPWLVTRWHDRMLNIHPSLLPAFKGLHTHERALAAGVRIHGCTVHLVRAELDDGPIVAQAAVAVAPDDTADSLAARVLAQEHRLYPLALSLLAEGRLRVADGRVIVEPPDAALALLVPPG